MPNNHFIVQDSISSFIQKGAKLYSNSLYVRDISRCFFSDEITECGRKLCYRVNGKKYICQYTNMEYNCNIESKKRWINILDHIDGVKVLESDVVASDYNYNIITKIDCVIEITEKDLQYVVLVKSVEENKFNTVKNNEATRKDIVEIMTNMWLIELSNGIIIYENRNSLDFIVYNVIPSNEIVNSVKEKTKKLIVYKNKGSVPPRPYADRESYECKHCEFYGSCWDKCFID